MGEAAMELSSEQKEYIENFTSKFIRGNLKVWIAETAVDQIHTEKEMELRERIIRVEESIDRSIALTRQGFEQMDKRFELLTGQMDKRFEQTDKRFEALTGQMDKRFEALTGQMDKRFEALTGQMDKRFEQTDKRFADMDKRFADMDKRFNQMFAYSTTAMVLLGVLVTVFGILN